MHGLRPSISEKLLNDVSTVNRNVLYHLTKIVLIHIYNNSDEGVHAKVGARDTA